MNNYDRFFEMLNQIPRIQKIWNKNTKKMDVPLFEKELKLMSSGECHMARFMAGVWLGRNTYEFDLIEAIAILDLPCKRIISDWIAEPFFP